MQFFIRLPVRPFDSKPFKPFLFASLMIYKHNI